MRFVITRTQASLLCVGVAILTFCTPYRASAQIFSDWQNHLEASGGYNHTTGDFGLNGFNVGTGYWLNRRISLNFEYDWTGKTSTLGLLSLTSIGHTAIKNRFQDWLIGPRIFFPKYEIKHHGFNPFVELRLGGSHLSEKISQVNVPSVSASGNSFAWTLGGGADYQFSSQWFGRADLAFLRTHFADSGQSRLRLVLGVGYTFRPRASSK